MKKSIMGLTIAGLVFGLTTGAATAQNTKAEKNRLDDRVQEVNKSAKREGMLKPAIHAVSVETGVPEDRIEALHKKHPDVGAAGIMISCVMADLTKKTPEEIIQQNRNGTGWAALANKNNVPIEKLNARLDNLDRYLANADTTKANSTEKVGQRERERERQRERRANQ
jgi:hypothetical protein